jgi:hypothetical protein
VPTATATVAALRTKALPSSLIDIESYTDARFGVSDGMLEWADLGPTQSGGCD